MEYDKAKPELFKKIIDKVRESGDMFKGNITDYSLDDYKKFTTYLAPDGKSGYAIKPDGELISVFSKEKGRGKELVKSAVESGAKKLDAFDIGGKLPKLYGKYFDEVGRLPFDDKYAPKDWNYKTLGRPDVVDMKVNPSKLGDTNLSKMADKDEIRVLKMLKDNPSSGLKSGVDDAVGRVAGVDFPKGTRTAHTDAAIKRRILESMRPAGAVKHALSKSDDAMVKGLANILKKSGSKLPAILGGAVGLGVSAAAEAADAPEVGESRELEAEMIEKAEAAVDPMVALRRKARQRGKDVLASQPSMDKVLEDKIKRDMEIEAMFGGGDEEAKAERRAKTLDPQEDKAAKMEMLKMLVDKGLR